MLLLSRHRLVVHIVYKFFLTSFLTSSLASLAAPAASPSFLLTVCRAESAVSAAELAAFLTSLSVGVFLAEGHRGSATISPHILLRRERSYSQTVFLASSVASAAESRPAASVCPTFLFTYHTIMSFHIQKRVTVRLTASAVSLTVSTTDLLRRAETLKARTWNRGAEALAMGAARLTKDIVFGEI